MSKLRTYNVGYWIEQGFSNIVEARSPVHAERIVRRRRDECADLLPASTRPRSEPAR